MIRLFRIPGAIQGFFEPVQEFFSKPQWRHFQFLVLALAIAWERHSWTSVHRLMAGGPWRQKLNDFMTVAPWDGSKALMQLSLSVLKRLRPGKGQTLYLILDESHLAKRAKQMAGLGWFWDSAKECYVYGHQFLALGFWFRDLFLPAVLSVYWPRNNIPKGQTFRTLSELAAEMIENVLVPEGLKVIVLFDAFFLNQKVLKAVRHRGFSWVSVAGANRNLALPRGQKSKVGTYRRTCWRKGFERVNIRAFGRQKRYFATKGRSVQLSKVGPVRLVFCKVHRHQTPLALVSPQGSVKQLIEHYAQRWAIEIFFKESKQTLGLGHYQTRSPQGVERHLQAVSSAHLLLTHVRLNTAREKAKANRTTIARQSLSNVQAQLRYLVLCDIQNIAMQKARRSPRALDNFINMLRAA